MSIDGIHVRIPSHHSLKCDADLYALVARGEKAYEVRLDDRGFKVDDTITLINGNDADETQVRVMSVVRLYGMIVPEVKHWWKPREAAIHGVVVMGIALVKR